MNDETDSAGQKVIVFLDKISKAMGQLVDEAEEFAKEAMYKMPAERAMFAELIQLKCDYFMSLSRMCKAWSEGDVNGINYWMKEADRLGPLVEQAIHADSADWWKNAA